ncbi:outer membrane protein [Frigidibacter sp.]|uniref:outer membrane protein n=1 Tax=Frigidibacter sp. TaxID=2586418 RepID=UPI0027376938|nr:outer membrane beta-barrel protein [Frigidibacter sp.]MDP3341254.1 outer membrane beta-barrel protein [Frigidibacter sp.]
MTLSKYSLPLLAAIGTTLALPALAGGLTEPVYEAAPVYAPAPIVATPNWAGGYTGVVLGYADDTVDITDDLGVSPDDQPNPKGGLAGLTGGYNFQSGNWVYGVEADIAATDLSDKGTFDASTDEYDVDVSSMATLRGRVGYDMGRWMPYATAGIAAAKADYAFESAGATLYDDDNTMTGYSAGVGAEYAINDKWSAKGEYLYTNLEGRFKADGAGPSADVDHEIHAVRAGLNYRF